MGSGALPAQEKKDTPKPTPTRTAPTKPDEPRVRRPRAPSERIIHTITKIDQHLPPDGEDIHWEFQGLMVEDLIRLIKPRLKGNLTLKDEIKKAPVPDTLVFSQMEFESLVQSLPALVEGLTIENADNILVIGGRAHLEKEKTTLFLPVNLEPLFEPGNPAFRMMRNFVGGAEGGSLSPAEQADKEKAKAQEKDLKIKAALDAVRRGVELDARLRGEKGAPSLTMEIHPETNLLLVGGPVEQVDAASKVLSALGVPVRTPRPYGGGSMESMPSGGAGMGMGGGMMPGLGGGMGMGAGMPGMGGGPGGMGGPGMQPGARNRRGGPGMPGGTPPGGIPPGGVAPGGGAPGFPGAPGGGGGFNEEGGGSGAFPGSGGPQPGFPGGGLGGGGGGIGAPGGAGAPGAPGASRTGAPGAPGASGSGAPGAPGSPGRPIKP